jgi:hypothetical protein
MFNSISELSKQRINYNNSSAHEKPVKIGSADHKAKMGECGSKKAQSQRIGSYAIRLSTAAIHRQQAHVALLIYQPNHRASCLAQIGLLAKHGRFLKLALEGVHAYQLRGVKSEVAQVHPWL